MTFKYTTNVTSVETASANTAIMHACVRACFLVSGVAQYLLQRSKSTIGNNRGFNRCYRKQYCS